jgi:hypothetical protein
VESSDALLGESRVRNGRPAFGFHVVTHSDASARQST